MAFSLNGGGCKFAIPPTRYEPGQRQTISGGFLLNYLMPLHIEALEAVWVKQMSDIALSPTGAVAHFGSFSRFKVIQRYY